MKIISEKFTEPVLLMILYKIKVNLMHAWCTWWTASVSKSLSIMCQAIYLSTNPSVCIYQH